MINVKNGPPEELPENVNKPVGIYDSPLWRDWAFDVGFILTGLIASVQLFGQAEEGLSTSAGGVISGLLDGAFSLATSMLFFSVLPATIRHFARKPRLKKAASEAPQRASIWLPDPINSDQYRFWNGVKWTGNTSRPKDKAGKIAIVSAMVAAWAVFPVIAFVAGNETFNQQRDAWMQYEDLVITTRGLNDDLDRASGSNNVGVLSDFIIETNDDLLDAAEALESSLVDTEFSSAAPFDTELMRAVAADGVVAGRTWAELANALQQCGSSDQICQLTALESYANLDRELISLYDKINRVSAAIKGS